MYALRQKNWLQIYRYLPGFDYIFVRPLEKNDIAFQSDRHIAKIDIPIAIFHAIDDPVVPFALGVKVCIHYTIKTLQLI